MIGPAEVVSFRVVSYRKARVKKEAVSHDWYW